MSQPHFRKKSTSPCRYAADDVYSRSSLAHANRAIILEMPETLRSSTTEGLEFLRTDSIDRADTIGVEWAQHRTFLSSCLLMFIDHVHALLQLAILGPGTLRFPPGMMVQ